MTIQAKSHFPFLQATLVFCLIIHLGASLRKQPDFPENQIRKRNVNYGSHQSKTTLPYKTGVRPEYDYDEPDDVQNYNNYEGSHTSYQTHTVPTHYSHPEYTAESETYSSPHYVSHTTPEYDAPIYKPSKPKYYDTPTYNEPNVVYGSAPNGYQGQISPYASFMGGYGYPFGYNRFGYGSLPYNNNYGTNPYAYAQPPPPPYPSYTPNYYPQIVYNTTEAYSNSTSTPSTSTTSTSVENTDPTEPSPADSADLIAAILGLLGSQP